MDPDEFRRMSKRDLFDYVTGECIKKGIDFDIDMLNGLGKKALLDFIEENFDEEDRIEPGCSIFPNAETDDDIDEEMEHINSRD